MIVLSFYPILLLMSPQINPNPVNAPRNRERCENLPLLTKRNFFGMIKMTPKICGHGHMDSYTTGARA